ncbi:MAG: hypothetical protein GY788_01350 [bacterium]|nr:hypothetical protein [bacterium]
METTPARYLALTRFVGWGVQQAGSTPVRDVSLRNGLLEWDACRGTFQASTLCRMFGTRTMLVAGAGLALILLGGCGDDSGSTGPGSSSPPTTQSPASTSAPSTTTSSTTTSSTTTTVPPSPYDESPFLVTSEEGWEYEITPSMPVGWSLSYAKDISSSPPGMARVEYTRTAPEFDFAIRGTATDRPTPEIYADVRGILYPVDSIPVPLAIGGAGCNLRSVNNPDKDYVGYQPGPGPVIECGGGLEDIESGSTVDGASGDEDESTVDAIVADTSQVDFSTPAVFVWFSGPSFRNADVNIGCGVVLLPDGTRFFTAASESSALTCGDNSL